MLQELRKKSRRHAVLVIIICAAIAAGMVALLWNFGLGYLFENPVYLNELEDDAIGVMRAEADINFIIDYYATYGTDDEVEEKYYLIPVGAESYMGIKASEKYFDDFDQLMLICQDYMMGERDDVEGSYFVKGTIIEMSGEQLRYYKEYYQELGWGGEEIFLPYCLNIDCLGKSDYSVYYLFGAIILILIIVIIFTMIKMLKGNYEKMIVEYCKKSDNYERALHNIERFYSCVQPVHKMRVSREYIMTPEGANTLFVESKELLWAYMNITEHRTYFIKTGETYAILLCMRDGSRHTIAMDSKQAAEEVLKVIHDRLSHVLIGYSDEVNTYYNRNRDSMIQEADRVIAEQSIEF